MVFKINKKDQIMKLILKKILKKIIPVRIRSWIKQVYFYLDTATFKNIIKNEFFRVHGYKLNLKDPKSFNEKVIYKWLFDRNPLIQLTSDKYRVRHYIEDKLGKDEAKKHLVPLLYVTCRPETIPFDELPDEYIIKPNHSWASYIIAENVKGIKKYTIRASKKIYNLTDTKEVRIEIIKVCKIWLSTNYGVKKNMWAYQKIKPLIIIEKLLSDSFGNIPDDYKFFMFHGKCKRITVCAERLSNLTFTEYDINWNLLNFSVGRPGKPVKKPEALDQMVLISEKLSKDFDFVRIDLYFADDNIYCGEITHLPGIGLAMTPTEFDFELGKYWKIK